MQPKRTWKREKRTQKDEPGIWVAFVLVFLFLGFVSCLNTWLLNSEIENMLPSCRELFFLRKDFARLTFQKHG
ncbi:rCG61378 [Rattus norvegicus]|uniref:RCG61378 n=1 Tax=Rattus norvegicus TaxID=10116 RepID=A6HB57_RAT|nr:rCG61378 [Rattus norvegicus]